MCVDAGRALSYCTSRWVIDRSGWVHTIHSRPCGSLHFHIGTVCLSALDNADTYALPWARNVVFCQPTASWAHACPTYHHGVPHIHVCMIYSGKTSWQLEKPCTQQTATRGSLMLSFCQIRGKWVLVNFLSNLAASSTEFADLEKKKALTRKRSKGSHCRFFFFIHFS